MDLLKRTCMFVLMFLLAGCAVVVKEKAHQAGGKVAVCHKDKKTMYVDDAAVKAHLGHGDYMGLCR